MCTVLTKTEPINGNPNPNPVNIRSSIGSFYFFWRDGETQKWEQTDGGAESRAERVRRRRDETLQVTECHTQVNINLRPGL